MKTWLKRFTIGTGFLIAILILFLLLSVIIDAAIGGERILAVTNTIVPGDSSRPDVRAYVAKPDGAGPFPAVIMIHEFFGLNESIVGKAQGLSEEGYYVIAPDTFRGATTRWIPRAIFQVISTDAQQVNRDLDAVYGWLEKQPEVDPQRIAIVGFCYGGRASLAYSLHNPGIAATVIFYGSPVTDPIQLAALNGPVLGIFGGADSSIPQSTVKAFESGLNEAKIPNEITIYPGQPHAFVTDIESIREGGVQAQAWEQMVNFFNKNLKSGENQQGSSSHSGYVAPLDWGYSLRLAVVHLIDSPQNSH